MKMAGPRASSGDDKYQAVDRSVTNGGLPKSAMIGRTTWQDDATVERNYHNYRHTFTRPGSQPRKAWSADPERNGL